MANAALSGKIQTVLGVIDGDELGITFPHEHLVVDLSSLFAVPAAAGERELAYEKVGISNLSWLRYHPFQNLDNVQLLDEREAIEEAMLFKRAGGCSIVDCTINGIGRDPHSLARIARSTGLNVIMGSGYYTAPSHGPEMSTKTEDQIAEEMIRDITDGVNGTGIKSGSSARSDAHGLWRTPNAWSCAPQPRHSSERASVSASTQDVIEKLPLK